MVYWGVTTNAASINPAVRPHIKVLILFCYLKIFYLASVKV